MSSSFAVDVPFSFAKYQQKRSRTQKPQKEFVPTEQQVLGMVGCLVGVFKRDYGVINAEPDFQALAGELLSARRIHCRGQRFGRTRQEITITACAAFERMVADGKIRLEEDSSGRPWLVLAEWKLGRRHKDRYTSRNRRAS